MKPFTSHWEEKLRLKLMTWTSVSNWTWTLCSSLLIPLPFHFLVQCLITWFRSQTCHMISRLCFSEESSAYENKKGKKREEDTRKGRRARTATFACVSADRGEKVPAGGRSTVQKRVRLFCGPVTSEQRREASLTGRRCNDFLTIYFPVNANHLNYCASYYTNYDARQDHVILKRKHKQALRLPFYCISRHSFHWNVSVWEHLSCWSLNLSEALHDSWSKLKWDIKSQLQPKFHESI